MIAVATILTVLCGSDMPAADPAHPPQAGAHIASKIPSAEDAFVEEHMTGTWNGLRSSARDRGFHFHAGHAIEAMANMSGGLRRGGAVQGLFEMSLDIDIARATGDRWSGAEFRVSSLYPHGHGLSRRHVGDLSTLSNLDAYDSFRIFEVWLDQKFYGERFSIRAGLLAADEEFASPISGELFLNSTFGWPPAISANVPTPSYPAGAPGVRGRLRWGESYFQAAIFDGDPYPQDGVGRPRDPHGFRPSLRSREGAFVMVETGRRFESATDLSLGGWWHTADFPDMHKDDAGLSLADPGSSGQPERHSGHWGLYAALDQRLYSEPGDSAQGLSAFTRMGGSPPGPSVIDLYFEGGFVYAGLIPMRDEDRIGIAAAYLHVSPALRRFERDRARWAGESPQMDDYEMPIEFTYLFQATPWWSIQADLQCIVQPGGSRRVRDAWVAGIRSTLVF